MLFCEFYVDIVCIVLKLTRFFQKIRAKTYCTSSCKTGFKTQPRMGTGIGTRFSGMVFRSRCSFSSPRTRRSKHTTTTECTNKTTECTNRTTQYTSTITKQIINFSNALKLEQRKHVIPGIVRKIASRKQIRAVSGGRSAQLNSFRSSNIYRRF